jgi:hypothetical protein
MRDLQIKPLVQPTKDIMKTPITTFQWHEFFPHGLSLSLSLSPEWHLHMFPLPQNAVFKNLF